MPFLRWKHIRIQSFSIMEVQNLQQKDSESLEDLKKMEEEGVEILPAVPA